jgi:hypothetical protein
MHHVWGQDMNNCFSRVNNTNHGGHIGFAQRRWSRRSVATGGSGDKILFDIGWFHTTPCWKNETKK